MKATVKFSHLILDSQQLGSDDAHMMSRVFFSLEVAGETYPGLHANIKQTIGVSREYGPPQIFKPTGYHGPFNQEAFRAAAEKRYRDCVTKHRLMFQNGSDAAVRMRNCTFYVASETTFEVDPNNRTW
jgi:hypothetical protein